MTAIKSVMNTRTSSSSHNGFRCGYSFFMLFFHQNAQIICAIPKARDIEGMEKMTIFLYSLTSFDVGATNGCPYSV